MSNVLLAGTLEKRSRWLREWSSRFFVLRPDRLDYFLTPPAILDDEGAVELRGSVPLVVAEASWEPERPHCLRLGAELLSCASQAEQQRWLETVNQAAKELANKRRPSRPDFCRGVSEDEDEEKPGLLLLQPDGLQKALRWHEPSCLWLAYAKEHATLLVLDGRAESTAQAVCRLGLYDSVAGEASFPVRRVSELCSEADGGSGGHESWQLMLKVHGNQLSKDSSRQLGLADARTALAFVVLAAALLLGSSAATGSPGTGSLLLAVALWMMLRGAEGSEALQPRCVTFSAERLARGGGAAAAGIAGIPGGPPKWTGRWVLDKSCSELYEPILRDMGVNFLVRKAADAKTSVLTIGASPTHVTIHVKTLVSVEDCLPLDGSWVTKAVPPAGRMRGEMRVRLAKVSATELEMHSEFPDGEGDLRDTLTVNEDGRSFTRVVTRGQLSCTRVFRLDASSGPCPPPRAD